MAVGVISLVIFGYIYMQGGQETRENKAQESDIYVYIFMHNEDPGHPNYPAYENDRGEYVQSRDNLVEFVKMLRSYGLPFNWQSDWNFLEGVRTWETAELMANTNSKNVVRYLYEDMGVQVDPHSHEGYGYNYADVAYLIENLGVTPSPVVGGFIWDPSYEEFSDWQRFENPLRGQMYENALWKGDILMGAGTPNHVDDPIFSGVWRPKDENNFFTHSENQGLIVVGRYKSSLMGVLELIDKMEAGEIEAGKMYTVAIGTNQFQLNSLYINSFKNNAQQLKDLEAQGKIHLLTITEIVDIWKTEYNGVPNIYRIE